MLLWPRRSRLTLLWSQSRDARGRQPLPLRCRRLLGRPHFRSGQGPRGGWPPAVGLPRAGGRSPRRGPGRKRSRSVKLSAWAYAMIGKDFDLVRIRSDHRNNLCKVFNFQSFFQIAVFNCFCWVVILLRYNVFLVLKEWKRTFNIWGKFFKVSLKTFFTNILYMHLQYWG